MGFQPATGRTSTMEQMRDDKVHRFCGCELRQGQHRLQQLAYVGGRQRWQDLDFQLVRECGITCIHLRPHQLGLGDEPQRGCSSRRSRSCGPRSGCFVSWPCLTRCTSRYPALRSTCCHLKAASSAVRSPWRNIMRIIAASRTRWRPDLRAACTIASTSSGRR